MLILRPLLLAFALLLTGCQTASNGFDDRAVRLGTPADAELKAFTAQLSANARERGLTDRQAAMAFARLGWERLLTRNYDEAASLLNRAWALDPDSPTVAAGFALIRHYRDDEPKIARQELVAAINRQPNDPALRMHYGRLLADLGEDGKALVAFQQALVLDAETPNVHLALSILYRRMGNYHKALDHARIGHARGEIPDPLWIKALEDRIAEDG
ncbi:MAG: tetratricopeptide repeat protein [Rhodospirillales bacterium]